MNIQKNVIEREKEIGRERESYREKRYVLRQIEKSLGQLEFLTILPEYSEYERERNFLSRWDRPSIGALKM